ncbi:MAG TPA: phytanoyl-CoA dioxygenase family protein [Chloroflexota bacterium]|jgi:ectoine hydroxylase-related dioxygenase (phytanoyl-CoA dioxygenase family)
MLRQETPAPVFGDDDLARYRRDGFAVARGLFGADEVAALRDHYMRLRAAGSYAGDSAGVEDPRGRPDPLKKYPRMIHMHRWDETSLRWMLDPRIRAGLAALLGEEPYAVQTMLYFKPPGARGQALHQDQFYLRVQPGTCMAAWMALDRCDEENGCMQVVPGSQDLPLLCVQRADTSQSFTDSTVPLPDGASPVPVRLQPGDVLFFNGSLIHGSGPNVSADRFRRSLIGHYVAAEADQVAKFYHPILRMDGSTVELGISERGGPCGVFVEVDGRQEIHLVDTSAPPPAGGE